MFTVDAKSTAPSKGTLPEDAGTPVVPEIRAYVASIARFMNVGNPLVPWP